MALTNSAAPTNSRHSKKAAILILIGFELEGLTETTANPASNRQSIRPQENVAVGHSVVRSIVLIPIK
jgi:hypothetical protein